MESFFNECMLRGGLLFDDGLTGTCFSTQFVAFRILLSGFCLMGVEGGSLLGPCEDMSEFY